MPVVGGEFDAEGEAKNETENGESLHRLVLLVAVLVLFHVGALVSSYLLQVLNAFGTLLYRPVYLRKVNHVPCTR